MFDPITATAGAMAIGAGGNIIGSLIGADASRRAAQTQANAAQRGQDVLAGQFQQTRADLAPYMQAGGQGLNQLMAAMGQGGQLNRPFTMSDLMLDPGYQFRTQQGLNALQQSAAARGGFFSGGTGMALQDYGQQMASNEFANAYGRYQGSQQDLYNRLMGLANIGQTSAAGVGNLGAQAAGGMSNAMMAGANAQAMGNIGAANAWQQGLGGLGNIAMQGLGMYQGNQLANQMMNMGQGGGYYPPSSAGFYGPYQP